MTIEKDKTYRIRKYYNGFTSRDDETHIVSGKTLKTMLRNYKYDKLLNCWLSPTVKCAYSVEEC